MRPTRAELLQALAERVGHRFEDAGLLEAATTHPSYRNEHPEILVDNQRLEFLGDAALDLAISERLYVALPDRGEGVLTMLRAQVVCEPTLASAARAAGVGGVLRMGRGERTSGGAERDSVLSDALEAIIGAVFLDAGYAKARKVALRLLASPLDDAIVAGTEAGHEAPALLQHTGNWKTALQQHLQRQALPLPRYTVTGTDGPAHAPRFRVRVQAETDTGTAGAEAEGSSKKAAESAAAAALLADLLDREAEVAAAVEEPAEHSH
ncbi:MAG: hypothetical protein RIT45_3258 [Pseudomonadota bacterium]